MAQTGAALGSFAVAGAFEGLLGRAARGTASVKNAYGPLRPVEDETTGLKLLRLPPGFRYLSFGWTGDPMADGTPTPAAHDGMAVIQQAGEEAILCRNHELNGNGRPFAGGCPAFDRSAPASCKNLVFNTVQGRWVKSWPSLSGTSHNCAGGPTPWGTWLTCEETVLGPGDEDGDERIGFAHEHGWIFEVPAARPADPRPLEDMGRFVHEAVAVDPKTGYVYETEDQGEAGFYRFIPEKPGELAAGGRLQMLKAEGAPDLRKAGRVGRTYDVNWVDINEPTRAHSPDSRDEAGVFQQGKAQGATTFARLEGCWSGNDRIYLVSTNGGEAERGQVWEYDPDRQVIRLLYESPGADLLDMLDKVTVSPRGGIVLCEDGDAVPHGLHGLTPEGELFLLATNNVVLEGEHNGIHGDFRGQEWAGATFSRDGRWLFVNLQTPGITFAITGPWEEGRL